MRGELGYARGDRFLWVGTAEFTRWLSGESTGASLDARYGVSPRWSIEGSVSLFERDDEDPDIRFNMAVNWHYR